MANDKKLLSLHNFFNLEQSKYVYFLLAASISSIAFWISRTSNLIINIKQFYFIHFLLFSSVAFWLLSIIYGISNRKYILSTAYGNIDALLILDGNHPKSSNSPETNLAAYEGIMEALSHNGKKAEHCLKLQFLFFCTGVITFSIWHILQILVF